MQGVLELRWYFSAIRRWLWLIVGCVLLTTTSAFAISSRMPPRLQRLLDPAGSRGPAFSKVGGLPTTVLVQEWRSSGNWVSVTGAAARFVPALFRQGGDAYRAVQSLGKSVCLRVGVIGASIARC
jgi:hypothetical protein